MTDNQKLTVSVDRALKAASAVGVIVVGLLTWALVTLQSLSVETAVIKAQLAEIQLRIDRQEARPCACSREL